VTAAATVLEYVSWACLIGAVISGTGWVLATLAIAWRRRHR
jgi:hypothetical protein